MGTWMRLSLSCALAWICCCTAFLEDKDLYLEGVEFSRTFDGYYIGPIHADQQHYIGDLVHDLDSYQHERETISTDCSEFECNITVKCLSSRNLVQLWENGIAKDEQVVALCPDVIRDEASKSCNVLVEKENEWNITTSYLKPTQSEVWGYGILSLVIITSCSVTGMLLLPIMSKDFYRKILVFFVSLGVGSLCGNSVFNLIPQALELFKDESQAYLWKMLLVACGIYLFFLTDRIMKFHMKVKQKKRTARKLRALLQGDDSSSTTERLSAMNPTEEELDPMYNHSIAMPLDQAQKKHGHEHIPFGDEDQTIATVAWMIMFGDSMHKIVDGLSIGAAFSDSIWVGISITLAVFCEEFPHELGMLA
ncbi:PREDICTED: zinc transporter ZIP14-like isoform X2 [Priapulus caudatus]|uniref:Zinc transporter ZIP14-like isoform X2 n=1 Tax=Priapulus caudatus TaxID=37621 RepID=A0ABM1EAK5_PRICU|nr:PREDICTED: zinc transporter ZIP14-like isoform X2 [Priapulus caudatus]